MPRRTTPKDLTVAEFTAALDRHGFARLRDGFLDLRAPKGERRHIRGIFKGRRLQRQATIEALQLGRAERERAEQIAAAQQAERERIAALIAPKALPPPRDGLEGSAAIAQLADDFLIISTRTEGAALPDLLRLGWRKEQVFAHADAARTLAYARQNGAAA